MEKQAVVKPGITPDLEEKCSKDCACHEKTAEEKDEIKRLAEQDACSRLADDAK